MLEDEAEPDRLMGTAAMTGWTALTGLKPSGARGEGLAEWYPE